MSWAIHPFGTSSATCCTMPGPHRAGHQQNCHEHGAELSVFLVPRGGLWGVPRYDLLLVIALTAQLWMRWRRIVTSDEAKTIALLHAAGVALEAFKLSLGIHSWSYHDPAYTKELGVPLVSGFMIASVGSYVMQPWRYPNQFGAWATVALGKWSSWAMLQLLSFTLVTSLKHVKERIHLAP